MTNKKTLKDVLEENKESFSFGTIKLKKNYWNDGVSFFEVFGITKTHALGLNSENRHVEWPLYGEDWELFSESCGGGDA